MGSAGWGGGGQLAAGRDVFSRKENLSRRFLSRPLPYDVGACVIHGAGARDPPDKLAKQALGSPGWHWRVAGAACGDAPRGPQAWRSHGTMEPQNLITEVGKDLRDHRVQPPVASPPPCPCRAAGGLACPRFLRQARCWGVGRCCRVLCKRRAPRAARMKSLWHPTRCGGKGGPQAAPEARSLPLLGDGFGDFSVGSGFLFAFPAAKQQRREKAGRRSGAFWCSPLRKELKPSRGVTLLKSGRLPRGSVCTGLRRSQHLQLWF